MYQQFCTNGEKPAAIYIRDSASPASFFMKGDLTTVRVRTQKGLEIITCQIASGYSLIAIQNCTDKPYFSSDAPPTAASDGQEAERDA